MDTGVIHNCCSIRDNLRGFRHQNPSTLVQCMILASTCNTAYPNTSTNFTASAMFQRACTHCWWSQTQLRVRCARVRQYQSCVRHPSCLQGLLQLQRQLLEEGAEQAALRERERADLLGVRIATTRNDWRQSSTLPRTFLRSGYTTCVDRRDLVLPAGSNSRQGCGCISAGPKIRWGSDNNRAPRGHRVTVPLTTSSGTVGQWDTVTWQ